VSTLEGIVGQLEERMQELAQPQGSAPSSPSAAASSLAAEGPPAASELVVASNALRQDWKLAATELATSRHILATLEQEYKDARE
jgi:hypothetical protein